MEVEEVRVLLGSFRMNLFMLIFDFSPCGNDNEGGTLQSFCTIRREAQDCGIKFFFFLFPTAWASGLIGRFRIPELSYLSNTEIKLGHWTVPLRGICLGIAVSEYCYRHRFADQGAGNRKGMISPRFAHR